MTPRRRLPRPELRPSRWTLRARLLAALVVLLAVVGTIVGVVSVALLDGALVRRLDDQLAAVVCRSTRLVPGPAIANGPPALPVTGRQLRCPDSSRDPGHRERPGGYGAGQAAVPVPVPTATPRPRADADHGEDDDKAPAKGDSRGTGRSDDSTARCSKAPDATEEEREACRRLASFGPPPFLGLPALPPGTLGLQVPPLGSGRVTLAAATDAQGASTKALTSAQTAQVLALPVDGRPHTLDLGGALGRFRVQSITTSHGYILISGLSTAEVDTTLTYLTGVVVLVTAAGMVLVSLLGAWILRLALRPLRRVAATAGRVVELPLDRGEVALAVRVPDADCDPRTEVGQVGHALNRLLGHVGEALTSRQASETRVRQFVADASHELRTPLASIRGYAELTRRSGEQVPPGAAHALSRVESEAARMTSLVEDLLLLARLDAGPAVDSAPVDLTELAVNAVSGARARLHQVVTNLLGNARTHTPPGTTVRLRLRAERDEAVIEVRDDGPGIPGELLPDVFERFARGDSSRSRAAGSTGLGLAIVAAVVEAHAGSVTVASRPGETVFTVRLPLARAEEEPPSAGRVATAGAADADGAAVPRTAPVPVPPGRRPLFPPLRPASPGTPAGPLD